MMASNGISRHVGNVIATMTKRDQTRDLFQEVLEEMESVKPSLKQCDKASGKRWNG